MRESITLTLEELADITGCDTPGEQAEWFVWAYGLTTRARPDGTLSVPRSTYLQLASSKLLPYADSSNPAIMTFEQLQRDTGYRQAKSLMRWLERNGINYQLGKSGRICGVSTAEYCQQTNPKREDDPIEFL